MAKSTLPRRWATIQETAAYIGVTPRTIRQMIADGRMRGYRNGHKVIRVDLNEVDASMTPMGGAA
ncbi:excisionase family DNA-binding protein [Gordonia sp. NPDC003422]